MKLYKSLLMTAVAAVALTSCSDEGYWEKYEIEGTRYSFDQAKQSYSLAATDALSNVTVSLSRNDNNGEVTLPLNVAFDNEIMSVDTTEVTFADGSYSAEFVVNIDEANIVMGTTYSAEISFVVDSVNFFEHNYSISGSKKHVISVVKDYTWVSAGVVYMASNWAGGYANVPVEKAQEYTDANGYQLYRLNSPYFYLEPSYCPKEGSHIQFILDADANAVTISPVFQAIGESANAGGEWFFYFHPQAAYCSFTNEGDVYTMKGAWAYTDAAGTASLYDYATELFQWTEGWPGATE